MTPRTILVVEDNPITQKLIAVTLEGEGYAVASALNGKTAIETAASRPPDLVLQDLVLPDMDGLDLVATLRRLPGLAQVPILAFSGFLSKIDEARSREMGFTDYVFKPVEHSQLLRLIKAYVPLDRPGEEKPGGGRRVLLANDDPVQRRLYEIHLQHCGFEVTTAIDGQDALEKAKGSPPDAIISDVLMPRMDGFRLCLAVRLDPRLARTRVLLISAAYTEEADRELARQVGANALIAGGPDLRPVIARLATLVGEPAPHLPSHPVELTEEYTHRLIRQLEHQVSLKASLAQRLSMREAELTILAGLTETLKNNLPIGKVVDELLHRCLDAAGVSKGAAYLLEPDGSLSLRAQSGFQEPDALRQFFGHIDRLQRILREGEPLALSCSAGAEVWPEELLKKTAAQSVILVPLAWGEERVGILVMFSQKKDLDEDWIFFGKAVGTEIGQALLLTRTLSELRDNQERLARIIDTLREGILIADRQGRFTFANAAAGRILGVPVSVIAARAHDDPAWGAATLDGRPFPSEEQPFCRVMQGLPAYDVEMVVRRPDGTPVILSVNSAPLRDPAGRIVGAVRSITDITERKRSDEALARYNAELEQFACVAAHDLQEPLRTVASFTQLLAQRYKGKIDAQADKFIEQAVSGCIRMRQLIDDLLGYTRVSRRPGDFQPTDCEEVFRRAVENLRVSIESSDAVVTHDSLPTIRADSGRLDQLLQNLVGNAIKFRGQEPPRVHVSAERKDDDWLFTVRDNGIGIEPRHADQIFQIFERLHHKHEYPGTGIGLAVCKKIVEGHHGRLWVESQPGQGSKFCFTLPAGGEEGQTGGRTDGERADGERRDGGRRDTGD